MTPLRQRMIEEMHLRNYSKHSIAAYVSAVYRLANHYGRRPDRLSREEIRAFLVDLVEEQRVSWPYYQQVLAALRYFYRHVVRRGEVVDDRWPIRSMAIRPERAPRCAKLHVEGQDSRQTVIQLYWRP
jgi:site-specific recombinase XerD